MTLTIDNSRSCSFTYGDSEGALCLSGVNDDRFAILATDTFDSYATFTFVGLIRVFGRGLTADARTIDMAKNISALKNLIRYSKNFSYQQDAYKTFDINVTSVDSVAKTATLLINIGSVSAFEADDVGLVIDIDSVGSFQIISFTNSSSVVVKLTPELDEPAVTPSANARILNPLFRTREVDKTNGFYGRPVLQRVSDSSDTQYQKTFLWTCVFQKPADQIADAGGRREGRVTVVRDPGTQLRTVVLTGIYTATNTGVGTFQTAVQNYEANGDAWASTVLADYGGGGSPFDIYEKRTDTSNVDDENAILTFTRSYQEKNFKDISSTSALNDPRITNQSIVMTRRNSPVFGLRNKRSPVFVQVQFSCAIDSTQVPATGSTGIRNFYDTVIYPGLIDLVRDEFGGRPVVSIESPVIYPDGSGLRVFLDIYISNPANASLYSFSKIVTYGLNLRKDTRDEWLGESHKYVRFTPSEQIRASVQVEVVREGPPLNRGVNRFSLSGALDPSSGSVVNAENMNEFQVPGTPPFTPFLGNGNKWLLDSATCVHFPYFRGFDLNGKSRQLRFTESLYVSNYLWGEEQRDMFVLPLNPSGTAFTAVTQSLPVGPRPPSRPIGGIPRGANVGLPI